MICIETSSSSGPGRASIRSASDTSSDPVPRIVVLPSLVDRCPLGFRPQIQPETCHEVRCGRLQTEGSRWKSSPRTSSTASRSTPATGARPTLVDPCTAESTGRRRCRRPPTSTRACQAAAAAFDGWRDDHAVGAQLALLRIADALERDADDSSTPSAATPASPRLDGRGGDPARGRPDPLLRGRGADARRPLGRRVHGRAHVVHPPRADRRRARRSRRGTTR